MNPSQSVYELPKGWCFSPLDDQECRNAEYIEQRGENFSPYDNWKDAAAYEGHEGNSWYGLILNMMGANGDYALFLPWQGRGTQVYFNGILIHETRPYNRDGTSPPLIGKPSFITVPFAMVRAGNNSLSLRTGSMNNIGGITYPILFGKYDSILRLWNRFLMWNSFLPAIDIFLFIYFMIIAYKRKKEKYYLYFSLLALSLGIWILGYKGIILFFIDCHLVFIAATYFASIIASMSFINFISHFFTIGLIECYISRVVTALHVPFLAALGIEYTVRGDVYHYQKYFYDMFMLVVVVTVCFGVYLCIRAVISSKPYAIRILLGVAVYSMAFMLSLPIFLNVFMMEPVLVEGFFIMTVIFATVLASRFARVHSELEELNISLTDINHEKDGAIDKLNIYKYIVSESRDHMAFIDGDCRFIEVNNALLKAYEKRRGDVINRPVAGLIGEEEFSAYFRENCESCLSGEPIVFERWHDLPGAGRRYMITSLLPYRAGLEEKTGIVYYSIDITDRIMFEQELVKISENERNAIGIELHDNLAQKLFGIALKSSILAGDIGDANKGAALEIESLINEAIAYVRNIAKSLSRVEFIDGGLASLLNELKSLMERRYRVKLAVDISCDIDMINRIHCSQIYYIMQEAVINSVKHSGADRIYIGVHRVGNEVQLLIKDDGVGIPDSVDRGKGIGLKIMKYRARMIGSSLSVQRGIEGGTEVICMISAEGAE